MSRRVSADSSLILLVTLVLGGCGTPREATPVPVRTNDEGPCPEGTMLERDLSTGGLYEGEDQIYLTPEGRACRYNS